MIPTWSNHLPSSTTQTSVLDRLRPDERAEVLEVLLDRHPDLRPEVKRSAMALLRDVTARRVADHLAARLMDLDLADVGGRAGRVPGGYVHPTEAAWELVEEAVAPIEADMRRCIDLGLLEGAQHILIGLVTALHRCSDPREGTVLAHAGPDMLLEHARWLVEQARRAGIPLDADEVDAPVLDSTLTAAGPHGS